MPLSTIPSTSSAISSPGQRFGPSDPRRRRNGPARPPRHDDSPLPVFRLERLNLTVPARASHEACIRVLAGMRDLARSTFASVRSVRGKLKRTDDELDLLTIVG